MPPRSHSQMPTAGRLVAAVCFGVMGSVAAFVGIPTLPEGTITGYFVPFAGLTGIWLGWSLMGPKAGGRFALAMTQAIATTVVMIVVVILGISGWDMVERSMRLRYDGPGEAVLDTANLFWGYLQWMAVAPVIQALLIGTLVSAILTNIAARIWK